MEVGNPMTTREKWAYECGRESQNAELAALKAEVERLRECNEKQEGE
jgi:hypothetical protein